METHGIHTDSLRKEVTCRDCGHVFLVENGQRSGACSACGNVMYFGEQLAALSEELVARRILPRLRDQVLPSLRDEVAPADPLEPFRSPADGQAVEALRMRYQVEWQLWSALVKRFEDPAHHMAYLTLQLASNSLEQAAARYREHRSVMTLHADSRWQADVADLMLSRIENLSLAAMPNHRGDHSFDIPVFLKLLPFDSRLWKLAWLVFGLCLAARLLHLPRLH